MTVAISLLVHGEAVRFNRGQSRGDDYDFKYMRGRDGKEYPYVSSQCYKRFWRESLPSPPSPITQPKSAGGKEKNQAYTDGDPIKYVDDDLFGYMIAGAAEPEEERNVDLGAVEADDKHLFDADNIKNVEALKKRLLQQDDPVSEAVLGQSSEIKEALSGKEALPEEEIQSAIVTLLNNAVKNENLVSEQLLDHIKATSKIRKQSQEAKKADDKHELNRIFLMKAFGKELQEDRKRPTTRRTAPVRMHALVAFSGIKLAKDFQTFSRAAAFTGKNSILNPTRPGIYSGWLKTRILIESHRIGRFYIGDNMELLREQVTTQEIKKEPNPYSRDHAELNFIELDETERKFRLREALLALANIGNSAGPASGALHDGSLRPKAFVAGMMTCVDSPFDSVWKGTTDDGMPFLDIAALIDAIKDWEDLFATKNIYFGLPQEIRVGLKETIEAELKSVGFQAVVDSTRKALLRLSEEAVL